MSLEREIIKRILSDVGVIPGSDFGKHGITQSDFKLDKKLTVRYDDGEQQEFPLWAGGGNLPGTKVRALLADLSDDEVAEYALALRVNDRPIYALRLTYDNEDPGIFVLQEGQSWQAPIMLVKAWALVGMEMIVEQGMLWEPERSYQDLYEAISNLVEM